MTFEVTYPMAVVFITVLWVLLRAIVCVKEKKFDLKHECRLLLVYVCLVVITRFVYFPLHHVDGHIGLLYFDSERILPFRLNFRVFSVRDYHYRGWLGNYIGNVLMFVPVGLIWPYCFEKLNRLWKVFLAGFACSLLIELSQLLFYNRTTDIDDLIQNTFGVLIGAAIYFLAVFIQKRNRERKEAE